MPAGRASVILCQVVGSRGLFPDLIDIRARLTSCGSLAVDFFLFSQDEKGTNEEESRCVSLEQKYKARTRKRTTGKAMSGGGQEMGRNIQGSQTILSNL